MHIIIKCYYCYYNLKSVGATSAMRIGTSSVELHLAFPTYRHKSSQVLTSCFVGRAVVLRGRKRLWRTQPKRLDPSAVTKFYYYFPD